jgi:hypothetical protein
MIIESRPSRRQVSPIVGPLIGNEFMNNPDELFTCPPVQLECEKCNQLGYIFINDNEKSYYAICAKCGGGLSEVWCPNCGTGGSFIKNIEKHPTTWVCPDCKTSYNLPFGFYENPTKLYTLADLPNEVKEQIQRQQSIDWSKLTFPSITLFLALVFVLLLFALWPLGILVVLDDMVPRNLQLVSFIGGFGLFLVWVIFIFPKVARKLVDYYREMKKKYDLP